MGDRNEDRPLIAMALVQAAANDRVEARKTLQRARQIVEALKDEGTSRDGRTSGRSPGPW